LLRALAGAHNNICCVGDADQSIYSWRGADIRNITSFEDDYPDATVVVLDVNYRSTGHILEAANGIISNNSQRIKKDLKSIFGDGHQVEVLEVDDEHAEARFIAGRVDWAMSNGHSANDIAIFYRTNAQSRVIEDTLARNGVNYQVIGGPKFYERAEVKDAVSYLVALVNENDDLALARIINTPKRGIGATTISKLQTYAATFGESLFTALTQAQMMGGLNAGTLSKIGGFVDLMVLLREFAREHTSVSLIIEHVYEKTGIIAALRLDDSIEAQGRIENLGELVNVAREYDQISGDAGSLSDFLQSVSLQSAVDSADTMGGIVTLMTIHNAKGLEYQVVFVAGMEEGLFPHARSIREAEETGETAIEEERRLAYVGITRARERLTLIHASSRTVFGKRQYNQPSRFLDELPEAAIKRERREPASWGGSRDVGGSESFGSRSSGAYRPGGAAGGNYRGASGAGSAGRSWGNASGTTASGASGLLGGGARQPANNGISPHKRDADQVPQLSVGDNVRHASFGEGVVLSIERGELVVVRFSATGEERRLMLAYAPLERI
ncbi:MAG: ATP-binding domain-containing protein, partial [Thermoleophilia bacterium]|nr:ATP-binding domain-containing protein [Thermoleophilia bacterium]